ncbi:MAG: hypothetical protein LAO08_18030 [Acidobacteriia bacterium]|nr:hypothetical protein [Terriglobia bacterium]
MTKPNSPDFALGAQDAAFLRIEHLSIVAASRSADNIPFMSRALGSRLSTDNRKMTLFFSAADAHGLLEHIKNNGMIAAVFALPSTHQALQLKGSDAKAEKPLKSDSKLVTSYRQAFVEHLKKFGYSPSLIGALLTPESEDIVAVTFTPSAAFSQTPGPNAGHAVGPTR